MTRRTGSSRIPRQRITVVDWIVWGAVIGIVVGAVVADPSAIVLSASIGAVCGLSVGLAAHVIRLRRGRGLPVR
jgi:hypothetical protein